MQIDQVLVSAAPGDAITNAAFEIRALLKRVGPSEIFARNVHPSLAEQVIPLEHYLRRRGSRPQDGVLIYHASIGDSDVHEFVTERRERLVLIYHNISPPEAFRPHAPSFAELLDRGRRDLVPLRERVHLALAVSRFNADELAALGYNDVQVLPPIVDVEALRSVEPDTRTTRELKVRVKGPLLLYVGQILPHKRPEFLVQAFHVLSTYLMPEAQLVLVGYPRLPQFRDALQAEMDELGLDKAIITGPVEASVLRAYYERADVFVTASDHEGFCVPLLEAMSFGVPVVARATSAIPETLGGAGLLVDPADSPLVFAEALAEVLNDGNLRDRLVALGAQRLRDFDADVTRARFLEQLLSVA